MATPVGCLTWEIREMTRWISMLSWTSASLGLAALVLAVLLCSSTAYGRLAEPQVSWETSNCKLTERKTVTGQILSCTGSGTCRNATQQWDCILTITYDSHHTILSCRIGCR